MSFQKMSLRSRKQDNIFKNIFVACSHFTNPLYKALSTYIDDNIITSPLSLHMMLSLLSNGADKHTLAELTSVLYPKNTASLNNEYKTLLTLLNDIENVEVRIANAVYLRNDVQVLSDFLSVCINAFQSLISKIDFKHKIYAAGIINSWVQKATNDKIFDVISPDDFDDYTTGVLINAIYFKGKWLHPFHPVNTEMCLFHVSKTEASLVRTMCQSREYISGEIRAWHTKFIEIPYKNQDIVMIILLPNEDVDLETLENNFKWDTLVKAARLVKNVKLHLPSFKLEVTIDLENVLRKIGLNTMFEDNANFKRLQIEIEPFKVTKILQKIFIKVDEDGSEAAAATIIRMMGGGGYPIQWKEFIVNRPFMFAIEHKPSKMPLFLGSVRRINSE